MVEQNEQLQSHSSDQQRVEKKLLSQAFRAKRKTMPARKPAGNKTQSVGQKGQLQRQVADKQRSEAKTLPQAPTVKNETKSVSKHTAD